MKRYLLTTFSGYDSQMIAALHNAETQHPEDEWELLGWSEIDEPAIAMHNLIFPQYADRLLGDITKIDWAAEAEKRGWPAQIDLFTYSSPCTDISQAGKQAGLKKGSDTRSALLWAVEYAIRDLKPKYLLQENVAALVSQKFKDDFLDWCRCVEGYGYRNFLAPQFTRKDGTKTKASIINARDCGTPQNRDRVFMISVREDVYQEVFAPLGGFAFPEPEELLTRLEDVLEDEVPVKYFLKDDQVEKFMVTNNSDQSVMFMRTSDEVDHATAMFIKTWWHRWFRNDGKWDIPEDALMRRIEWVQTNEFPKGDWRQSPEMLDADFVKEFEYNMSRTDSDPEFWETDTTI